MTALSNHQPDISGWIAGFLRSEVKRRSSHLHRDPLVGLQSAGHPGFARLGEIASADHLTPSEILPGARSVLAFFLPFAREVVEGNRGAVQVARSWAVAYVETNRLIIELCRRLADALGPMGVRAAWTPPTHDFDPVRLVSRWSHKHVAYLCGLGTFGVHHQLITPAGCAGRIGSLVLDMEVEPRALHQGELCVHKAGGSCLRCVSSCPTGALSSEGLDRRRCHEWLCRVDRMFSDLPKTDVCGKCSVQTCAVLESHQGHGLREPSSGRGA